MLGGGSGAWAAAWWWLVLRVLGVVAVLQQGTQGVLRVWGERESKWKDAQGGGEQ